VSERNYITSPGAVTTGEAKVVSIEKLVPNRWNYNTQSAEVFNKLVESIRRFGYSQPVIVRSLESGRYEIINGEHRWRAAQALKWGSIEVFDLGKMDDTRAKELCVILNNLGGKPDEIRLADLLRDINESVSLPDMVAVMPFTARDMEHLVSSVDFQFEHLSTEDDRSGEEKAKDEAKEALVVEFLQDDGEEVLERLLEVDVDVNVALETILAAWEKR
jgi:hypothetical protein